MWLYLTTTHRQTWLFSFTSTYHSSDLLTARGVAHLVVHGTSGWTSYEMIPPVPLESSGGVLSTADMVVQRRDGPRRLRDDDGDDYIVFYTQNADRVVTLDSVTSLHPMCSCVFGRSDSVESVRLTSDKMSSSVSRHTQSSSSSLVFYAVEGRTCQVTCSVRRPSPFTLTRDLDIRPWLGVAAVTSRAQCLNLDFDGGLHLPDHVLSPSTLTFDLDLWHQVWVELLQWPWPLTFVLDQWPRWKMAAAKSRAQSWASERHPTSICCVDLDLDLDLEPWPLTLTEGHVLSAWRQSSAEAGARGRRRSRPHAV